MILYKVYIATHLAGDREDRIFATEQSAMREAEIHGTPDSIILYERWPKSKITHAWLKKRVPDDSIFKGLEV